MLNEVQQFLTLNVWTQLISWTETSLPSICGKYFLSPFWNDSKKIALNNWPHKHLVQSLTIISKHGVTMTPSIFKKEGVMPQNEMWMWAQTTWVFLIITMIQSRVWPSWRRRGGPSLYSQPATQEQKEGRVRIFFPWGSRIGSRKVLDIMSLSTYGHIRY